MTKFSWRVGLLPLLLLASTLGWGQGGAVRQVIRIDDVSPVHSRRWGPEGKPSDWSGPTDKRNKGRSSAAGKISSVALSTDGTRAYAGGVFTGVWRSDDGGIHWRQMRQQQSGDDPEVCLQGGTAACGLPLGFIADIAVWPVNPDLVFVALAYDARSQGRDGVYRSQNGGQTWTKVLTFDGSLCSTPGSPTQPAGQLAFAPDDSTKLWAAGGCGIAYSVLTTSILPADPASRVTVPPADAINRVGVVGTWSLRGNLSSVWHIAVAPREPSGKRRIYGCGVGALAYSSDGGRSFIPVTGVRTSTTVCSAPGEGIADGRGVGGIAVLPQSPNRAYVAVAYGSNADVFFEPGYPPRTPCRDHRTTCGEAHLMSVTVSDPGPTFQWNSEADPPIYYSSGTGSGAATVAATRQNGLIFIDRDNLNIINGTPAINSWHRLDGPDATSLCLTETADTCNKDHTYPQDNDGPIHYDPQKVAFTPGFAVTLAPATSGAAPYRTNSVIRSCAPGQVLLLANDGGVYRTTNCGVHWTRSEDLKTLAAYELAGISIAGVPPSLYFGMPDNDSLYSNNGGSEWRVGDDCGDCLGYWTDPLNLSLVLHINRYDALSDWRSSNIFRRETAPDLRNASFLSAPLPSGVAAPHDPTSPHGSRPIIFTQPGQTPNPGGSFVVAAKDSDGYVQVWRRVGNNPFLPLGLPIGRNLIGTVVQAAGPPDRPVFLAADRENDGYTGQPLHLWRSPDGGGRWTCIVPGPRDGISSALCRDDPSNSGRQACPTGQACRPFSFVSDPYHTDVIYISDYDGIKLSVDGGRTWRVDDSLNRWLRNRVPAGCLSPRGPGFDQCGPGIAPKDLSGIIFVPGEPRTRFAFGIAGVFYTTNAALGPGETENWHRLLDSDALACMAGMPFFDPVGAPSRALYVPCEGRSILRIWPIPRPGESTQTIIEDATDIIAIGLHR